MPYESSEQFKEVMDKAFGLMGEDTELVAKLKEVGASQRLQFDDLELVVCLRPAREGEEGALVWEWSEPKDWEPRVRLTMSSETCNRYLQGAENVAVALARQRIKAGGDVKAALAAIGATRPVFERYRALVEAEYPHLVA